MMIRKLTKKNFIFIAMACIIPAKSLCAANAPDADTCFYRSLIISLDYGSDQSFHGRTASVKVPYLSPSIAYEAPSGFFCELMSDRILSPRNRWDEIDLGLGWRFFMFKKKIESSLSYSHYIYGKQSIQVQSSLKNNLEMAFKRQFKIIKTTLFLDYDFGTGSRDYSFTLDNTHYFIFNSLFREDDELKVKPLVSVSAGTLNFYKLHLKNPVEKPSLQNLETSIDSKFNLTGIELSLPVEYLLGRFSFEPAVNYSIPLNQPKRFNATPVTYFTVSVGFALI